jgi:hypothetical protein
MKVWDRVKLGLKLIFGWKYGIIVDEDYATGGTLTGFDIVGADVGIQVYYPSKKPPPEGGDEPLINIEHSWMVGPSD